MSKRVKSFPIEFVERFDLQFHPFKPDVFEFDSIEIGPGKGEFIIEMATAYPERSFLGIELGGPRFRKLSRKLTRLGINNVWLIRADARVALPRFVGEKTVSHFYVLFPDPWPKRRHEHNRLLTVEFLSEVFRYLKPGGELFHATDVEEYAEWVVANCRKIKQFGLGEPLIATEAPVADYRPTHFERKWRAEGKNIYYVRCFKEGVE